MIGLEVTNAYVCFFYVDLLDKHLDAQKLRLIT